MIVSCLPDEFDALNRRWIHFYGCDSQLNDASVPRVTIAPTDISSHIEELAQILRQLLLQEGRILSEEQWTVVLDRLGVEPTPLYVNLALRVVKHWTSSMQSDTELQLAGGVRNVLEQIFVQLQRDYGTLLVCNALAFITYSKNGVSDVEMDDLLSLSKELLSTVFQYATPTIPRMPTHVWQRLKGTF